LSGNPLPNAPNNKIAVNANYTFHTAPGNFTASVSYIWRSDSYSNLFNNKLDIVPAYSQTNARIIFREKDDKWQAILFAQNLFDQDVFEAGGNTRRRATADQIANLPDHSTVVASSTLPGGTFDEIYYRTYGLVLPRVWGIEFMKKFR
ncbi:MAG TPA: hypothetical protein VFN88_09390, partial [Caulobacteraceae bacterium]|nr:hypothetical protein [Caulobacteraceae bacterium]